MDKCSKYESLFIFSNQENLEKHIAECEDCKNESEQQQKVSELLDEVKFYYHWKNKRQKFNMRAACAVFLVCISMLSLSFAVTNEDLLDTLKYGSELSAEDLGFPVDSYGLLMVDE